jgi:hypothetical protein
VHLKIRGGLGTLFTSCPLVADWDKGAWVQKSITNPERALGHGLYHWISDRASHPSSIARTSNRKWTAGRISRMGQECD